MPHPTLRTTLSRLLAVGLTAAALGAVAVFALAAAPRFYAPAPLIVVVPMFWLDHYLDHYIAAGSFGLGWVPILVGGAYLSLAGATLRRPERPPVATAVVFSFAVLASIVFFFFQASDGLSYQGGLYVAVVGSANLLAVMVNGWLMRRALERPSFLRRYLFDAGLALWLAWLSFPWLGEML